MRIGLISDTHITGAEQNLPEPILRAFSRVDLILHCGDLESLSVLDEIEKIAPVKAVRGHTDPFEDSDRLQDGTRIVTIENINIGMIHDLEWPNPGIPYRDNQLVFPDTGLEQLLYKKFGQLVDIVVFGDTHEEMIQREKDVLFINPGSPTRPSIRRLGHTFGTVVVMDITSDTCSVEIVDLERIEA